MTSVQVDVIVIGAGPAGGGSAALRAGTWVRAPYWYLVPSLAAWQPTTDQFRCGLWPMPPG